MKKLLTFTMFIVLLIASNVAFASYADIFEKKYPNKVEITYKDIVGGKDRIKCYDVYSKDTMHLTAFIHDSGEKSCTFLYTYVDKAAKNYGYLQYSDGKNQYKVKLDGEPLRMKLGDNYMEALIADIDPSKLKNAINIAAVTEKGQVDILLSNRSAYDWEVFIEALDEADKILNER